MTGLMTHVETAADKRGVRDHNVWTPAEVVCWARACLGRIDLDPASCAEANETVRAERYYTAETDGLQQGWHGRVWLNPPFNGGLLRLFARRLISEVEFGAVTAAVMLGPVVGGSTWPDEMARAADWIAPLRQHIPWGGVGGGSSAMGHQLWGFRCEPAPLDTGMVTAVFHRISAERTLFGVR